MYDSFSDLKDYCEPRTREALSRIEKNKRTVLARGPFLYKEEKSGFFNK